MEIDELLNKPNASSLKYRPDVKPPTISDFNSSKSGWDSASIPSSPESLNLNKNLYKRKKQTDSGNFYWTNYARTSIKDPGYYFSDSSTGSISPPNSPSINSSMKLELKNTPLKEEIRIGLKPSERISYYREILPLYNQPGYIPHSQWELMVPPKAPLRRPNSLSSHFLWNH